MFEEMNEYLYLAERMEILGDRIAEWEDEYAEWLAYEADMAEMAEVLPTDDEIVLMAVFMS